MHFYKVVINQQYPQCVDAWSICFQQNGVDLVQNYVYLGVTQKSRDTKGGG